MQMFVLCNWVKNSYQSPKAAVTHLGMAWNWPLQTFQTWMCWMYIVYIITTSIVSSYFAVSGSSLLLLLIWLPFLVWSSFYSTAQTLSIRPFLGGFLCNPTMCKWSHPWGRSQWSIWVSKHTTPKKISLSPHLHSYNLGVQPPIPPRHRLPFFWARHLADLGEVPMPGFVVAARGVDVTAVTCVIVTLLCHQTWQAGKSSMNGVLMGYIYIYICILYCVYVCMYVCNVIMYVM